MKWSMQTRPRVTAGLALMLIGLFSASLLTKTSMQVV